MILSPPSLWFLLTMLNKLIYGLKSFAVDSDDISIRMLTLCGPGILPVITHIINTCLLERVFPTAWKEAFVAPIPKGGDCTALKDASQYSVSTVENS